MRKTREDMRKLTSLVALLAVATFGLVACGDDVQVPAGPQPQITSVSVTPSQVSLNPGETATVSADVQTQGDVGSLSFSWSSNNPGVASVSGNGSSATITGEAKGTTSVSVEVTAENVTNPQTASTAVEVTPEPQPKVNSVSLNRTQADLLVGESVTLVASVDAEEGANTDVQWNVGDETVASLSVDGKQATVTGEGAGQTVVTVESVQNPNKNASATINVSEPGVNSIAVTPSQSSVQVGGEVTLVANVDADQGAQFSVMWSSASPDVASVASTGGPNNTEATISAEEVGTAVVTAQAGGKSAQASIEVTEGPQVNSVSLNRTSASLLVGESVTLVATVDADDDANTAVSWSQSDPSVATLDVDAKEATVTADAAGQTVVSVESVQNPNKGATATISVSEPGVNSISVSPASATLDPGATQQLVASVDAQAGAQFTVSWQSNDAAVADVTSTSGDNNQNATITANAAGTAAITASAGDKSATATIEVRDLEEATVSFAALPTATTGPTDVVVNLDPGDQQVDEVILEVEDTGDAGESGDFEEVASQNVGRSTSSSDVSSQADNLELSFNAAEIRLSEDDNTRFDAGTHRIRARATLEGGTTPGEDATTTAEIDFDLTDTFLGGLTVTSQPAASPASDAAGLQWYRGTLRAEVIPAIFTPGRTIASVTFFLENTGGSMGPPATPVTLGTATSPGTNNAFSVTAPMPGYATDHEDAFEGQADGWYVTSTDVSGSAGPTEGTSDGADGDPAGAAGPTGGAGPVGPGAGFAEIIDGQMELVRLDNDPPAVPTTSTMAGSTSPSGKRTAGSAWINADFDFESAFTSAGDGDSNGDGDSDGVGGLSHVFRAGTPGNLSELPNGEGGDLAETGVVDSYRARVVEEDALNNSLSTLINTARGDDLFGVDKTAYTLAFTPIGPGTDMDPAGDHTTSEERFNARAPAHSVFSSNPDWEFGITGEMRSGFTSTPLRVGNTRTIAGTSGFVDYDGGGGTSSEVTSLEIEVDGDPASDAVGYYTIDAVGLDRAGNMSNMVTRQTVMDAVAPAATGIGLPTQFVGGVDQDFTLTVTEDHDLFYTKHTFRYDMGGAVGQNQRLMRLQDGDGILRDDDGSNPVSIVTLDPDFEDPQTQGNLLNGTDFNVTFTTPFFLKLVDGVDASGVPTTAGTKPERINTILGDAAINGDTRPFTLLPGNVESGTHFAAGGTFPGSSGSAFDSDGMGGTSDGTTDEFRFTGPTSDTDVDVDGPTNGTVGATTVDIIADLFIESGQANPVDHVEFYYRDEFGNWVYIGDDDSPTMLDDGGDDPGDFGRRFRFVFTWDPSTTDYVNLVSGCEELELPGVHTGCPVGFPGGAADNIRIMVIATDANGNAVAATGTSGIDVGS